MRTRISRRIGPTDGNARRSRECHLSPRAFALSMALALERAPFARDTQSCHADARGATTGARLKLSRMQANPEIIMSCKMCGYKDSRTQPT
jgi:hypothetical protein